MRLLAFSFLGLAWIGIGCGAGGASGAFTTGGGGSTSSGTGATTGTTSSGITTTTFTTTTHSGAGGASTSSSSSSSTSASTSGTGGTDGGTTGSGDCHSSADCPSGQCVAVTPGGFEVCLVPPVMATTCAGTLDQCCPTTQHLCSAGAPCFVGPLVPVCAGIPMPTHNVCGVDQCTKDVDCAPGQICAPAGTLGLEIKACVAAHCKVDADCAAHPGGVCAPVQDPCCAATDGLFCVYPSDGGCRKNADCPPTSSQPSRYCAPDAAGGVASCQPGGPVCPA